MTHQLLLRQINLRHRLPQRRQIKQRIITKPAVSARLEKYLALDQSLRRRQYLLIASRRNHAMISSSLRPQSPRSKSLQQIQIVPLVQISRRIRNKSRIVSKPSRSHPRLTTQCVYFQPRIVSNNDAVGRETAVIDSLEPSIVFKRKPVFSRSSNVPKTRQRNHIELENLSRRRKITQLARVTAGNIKNLSHKSQTKAVTRN